MNFIVWYNCRPSIYIYISVLTRSYCCLDVFESYVQSWFRWLPCLCPYARASAGLISRVCRQNTKKYTISKIRYLRYSIWIICTVMVPMVTLSMSICTSVGRINFKSVQAEHKKVHNIQDQILTITAFESYVQSWFRWLPCLCPYAQASAGLISRVCRQNIKKYTISKIRYLRLHHLNQQTVYTYQSLFYFKMFYYLSNTRNMCME